jgi:hypothetical protein
MYDFSANTGDSQSITAVGTVQSDTDNTTGKLSSLSNHAKPWSSGDRPPSSKSRRLFGIEIDSSNNYNDTISVLPGSGSTMHGSRAHDFALALPDPGAPDADDDYLDKMSPGIPSPALLLPEAAALAAALPPLSGGGPRAYRDVPVDRNVDLALPKTPTSSRFALAPLRLSSTANKRLPPTPTGGADENQNKTGDAPRSDLDRRRVSTIDDGASESRPEEEEVEEEEDDKRSPNSVHDLSSSPPQSDYDVVLDDESSSLHRRRGDESHMTFLVDESDEESWRKSLGAAGGAEKQQNIELRSLEPAHVKEQKRGAFDRWRT